MAKETGLDPFGVVMGAGPGGRGELPCSLAMGRAPVTRPSIDHGPLGRVRAVPSLAMRSTAVVLRAAPKMVPDEIPSRP